MSRDSCGPAAFVHEYDCVRCGAYVGVKANPLDDSDERPLCYDCAVADWEEIAPLKVAMVEAGWDPDQVDTLARMRRREYTGGGRR